MWKLLKIPSNHLNLPLCNMKNREKLKILGQCSNFSCLSSTTSDTHKKTTFSNINNHRFNGGFNNNNLFKQKIVNFDGKIVRHMSDEVPRITADIIVAPPVPKFEGITKILVDSPPIEFFQNTLIWLHDTSGLPWWANIVLFSCAMRTFITLPSALYQQSIFAKVANLKYEMDEIVPELKKEANYRVARLGYTEEKSRQLYNKAFREKYNELIVRDNCHPMKGFVLLLTQLPMWICLSASIRNLCYMLPAHTPLTQRTFLEMSEEGCLWITNLAEADPYYIFPIAMGLFNLMNIEIGYMMRVKEATTMQKININIFRGLSFLLVPVSCFMPAGMSLYWTTSSLYGIFQNLFIVSPRVRRLFRIEWTEYEHEHPYKKLLERLRQRLPGKSVDSSSSSILKNPLQTSTPLKKQ